MWSATSPLIQPGMHVCLVYDDDQERHEALVQFVAAGLQRGELVEYLGMDQDRFGALTAETEQLSGPPLGPHGSGHLVWTPAQDAYCATGTFSGDQALARLATKSAEAHGQGFTGYRVTGETNWVKDANVPMEELVAYEGEANQVVRQRALTAVCQYDARLFPETDLRALLQVHDYMIMGTTILANHRTGGARDADTP